MKKEMMFKSNEDLAEENKRVNHQTSETILFKDWDNDNEEYSNENDTDDVDDTDDDLDDDWYPKPNRYFLPSTNIELILGNIRRKLKL